MLCIDFEFFFDLLLVGDIFFLGVLDRFLNFPIQLLKQFCDLIVFVFTEPGKVLVDSDIIVQCLLQFFQFGDDRFVVDVFVVVKVYDDASFKFARNRVFVSHSLNMAIDHRLAVDELTIIIKLFGRIDLFIFSDQFIDVMTVVFNHQQADSGIDIFIIKRVDLLEQQVRVFKFIFLEVLFGFLYIAV